MATYSPGDLLPVFTTKDPWRHDEAQQLVHGFLGPDATPMEREVSDQIRLQTPQASVSLYRHSRSMLWRANRGARVTAATEGFKDLVAAAFALGDPDLLLREIDGVTENQRRFTFTALPSKPMRRRAVSISPTGVLVPTDLEQPWAGVSDGVGITLDGLPFFNARMIVERDADHQVRAVDLFWNRPLGSAGQVATLPLPELSVALRCKGLDKPRWTRPPQLGYRIGYPHLRQRLLLPIYRLDAHVNGSPMIAHCTAYRSRDLPSTWRDVHAAFMGDVIVL